MNACSKTISALFAGSLLFFLTPAWAQFSLTGEIRPRTEYRHGFKTPADSAQDAAFFTDQRTRINFGYRSEGYHVKIAVQDVRVWGSQQQLLATYTDVNPNGNLLSVHEAWAEALFCKNWSFKFGRQEIIYDDHRIFGNVGWAQQARSHDAGIFTYKDSTFSFHLGLAYNQDKAQSKTTFYSIPKSYKALQYVWMHKNFGEAFGASLLVLNNGLQVQRSTGAYDNYSQTIGPRLSYKRDKLNANAALYMQTGVAGDTLNSKINAIDIGFDFTYNLSDKFSAGVGFEFLSGQSQTDTTKSYTEVSHAFNPLYGTNHKFNGHMDYFYVGNHINNVGLQDIFFRLKYKTDAFFAGTDVHLFSAAANVLDQDVLANTGKYTAMNSSLGTEIDLSGGFTISKGVNLKAGYSIMLATNTLATVKGVTNYKGEVNDETNQWAWVMIIVKPDFLGNAK